MDLMNFRMRAAPIATTAIGHTSPITLSQQRQPLAPSDRGNTIHTPQWEANSFSAEEPRNGTSCCEANGALQRGTRLRKLPGDRDKLEPSRPGKLTETEPKVHFRLRSTAGPGCSLAPSEHGTAAARFVARTRRLQEPAPCETQGTERHAPRQRQRRTVRATERRPSAPVHGKPAPDLWSLAATSAPSRFGKQSGLRADESDLPRNRLGAGFGPDPEPALRHHVT